MRVPVIVATALLLALSGCRSQTQAPSGTNSAAAATAEEGAPDGVTVTGQGRATGAPDTLRATVGVEVVRDDVQTALQDANEAAEAVVAALREQGIAEEDIRTTEFSVRPRRAREPGPAGDQAVEGYVVRNLVEATIRDVDTAGSVLGAVVEAGGDAARVEHVRFALEDDATQVEEAREAAFEDARAKAEQYAELAERSLGALVSVTEVGVPGGPSPPVPVPEEAARGGAVPIEPGRQEVDVRIQATWELD
jgi:uncharacterized protein YggE